MICFVMTYHLGDLERAKERDVAFLKAWINSAAAVKMEYQQQKQNTEIGIEPKKNVMPFYTTKTLTKSTGNPTVDSYRWLIL